jgi:hypothetical protein
MKLILHFREVVFINGVCTLIHFWQYGIMTFLDFSPYIFMITLLKENHNIVKIQDTYDVMSKLAFDNLP